jgi:cell wall-associated NlpC family hydrolase
LCYGIIYSWDLGTIKDTSAMLGADKIAEKAIIGRFVSAFKKERPISTGIEDAYPKASGIQDFKPQPVSRKVMEELRLNGQTSLNPGVHDFYFQSFCLHAGKHAPKRSGSGYLIAPLKGSQAEAIKHILQNYPRCTEIQQYQAQYLIWAIEVGCKFGDLTAEEQAVALKILSREDLKSLNKSFWDILPKSVRSRLFSELKEQLPNDVRDVLEVYNDIQSKIAESKYSYEQLESIAVQFGDSLLSNEKEVVEWGAWCNTGKGYYMRIFSTGFTRTRVQIYIPKENGNANFNPVDDIGVPANTDLQRLGNGCADSGDGGSAGCENTENTGQDSVSNSGNSGSDGGENDKGNATQKAKDLIGAPYSELDCSGLTHKIYPQLPCGSQNQYNYFFDRGGIIPSRYDLQEGDLIFFDDGAGNIKHVGYVLSDDNGNITFIDSINNPDPSKNGVHYHKLTTGGIEGSEDRYGCNEYFSGGGRIK